MVMVCLDHLLNQCEYQGSKSMKHTKKFVNDTNSKINEGTHKQRIMIDNGSLEIVT